MSIDLSLLPPPEVIEPISFEIILAEMKADFVARWPDAAAIIDLESDPVVKLLEVAAYREIVLRARINDAARAVMLAHAGGADLEHLAALLGVARLADEDDTRLRYRTQLALEGFSTAGPIGAYRYHTLSVSSRIADCAVASPQPGDVLITILDSEGNGAASAALLDQVATALSADDVRPLTDHVIIQSADIVDYQITASLITYPGPDAEIILQAAHAAAADYIAASRRLGYDITLSGIYAALHRPGVQRVDLSAPAANIVLAAHQAAHCTAVAITLGGTDV